MTQFLAEMDGWNPATGAVETTRWADGAGFWNEAGDTPPDVFWEPDLIVPEEPLYKRSLFADGRTGGGTQVQISEGVAIRNLDGRWDRLADWGWDGRRFRLWRVEPGETRAEAVLVLSGVVEQLLPVYEAAAGEIDSRLVVRLKDPLSRFDQPIQPTLKYAGTNSGPDGLEGTENDLKGLPKPIAYGVCPEVPARPVNTSLLIYQVADGAVAEISAVYDAGLLLALDADYATPTLLAAATPAEGEYATCVAYGLFMLGAEPFGTVTADVSTVAAPLPSGDAVQLDGSTQYFSKSSGVTGAPGTDRGVVSLWFRVDDGDGTERTLLLLVDSTFEAALRVWLGTDDKLHAAWVNAGGAEIATVVSTSAYAAAADWHHVALAWIFPETGSPYLALWIDAGNQTNPTITGTSPFDPLRSIRVGAAGTVGATQHFPGALAEVWVAWGQFVDVTVSSGRERLRTLGGYPTDLGPTGAKVTGISPVFYLRGGPDQFGSNLGTGGNLTGSGGPTVATSTPYAPPPATPSVVTAAEIIRDVATARAGVTEEEIDGNAFDQASLDAPEAVGIWIGAERTVREVLDEIANSAGLAYWWRSDGLLTVGRFRLPSGPPAATIEVAADQISLARQPVTDTGYGLPAYSIVVEHSPIYQVQEAGALAEAVDTARAAYLATQFRRAAPTADNSIRDKHPLAPELTFRTQITDSGDADDFAADRLALYGRQRSRWLVTVPLTAAMAAVQPFDVVAMRDDRPVPRFGLGGGRLFRVLGIAAAWRAKTVEFDLWGGVTELFGDDPIQGWSLPSGRVGGLRGAAFTGWTLGTGRVGNITGLPVLGWTLPDGSVLTADLLTTEAGDPLVTEGGDNLILEE